MVEIRRPQVTREQLERWLNNESGLMRGRSVPALERLRQNVIIEGLSLATPILLYRVLNVSGVRHNRLWFEDGYFDDPWFVGLMAPSRLIFVAICTIGPLLEQRASAYAVQGDGARAYLLDAVGTGLVELTRCNVLLELEAIAAKDSFEISVPLSPGDTQWPLAQQQRLFDLLPAGKIGVTLSPNFVMQPLKSASLALGAGPNLGAVAEGSACDYCDIRDRCQLRLTREKQEK